MTKEKFRILCRQILIPYLGDLMNAQLIELYRSFDILSAEVFRIGRRVDWIAGQINAHKEHENNR